MSWLVSCLDICVFANVSVSEKKYLDSITDSNHAINSAAISNSYFCDPNHGISHPQTQIRAVLTGARNTLPGFTAREHRPYSPPVKRCLAHACLRPCTRAAIRDAVWVVHSGGLKEACVTWGAHWRHLANTTEPSVCGGDAALRQITLNMSKCLQHQAAVSSKQKLLSICWRQAVERAYNDVEGRRPLTGAT